MGFQMPPILVIVGLVCAGVGLLFQIIGVATPEWYTYTASSIDVTAGLWKFCLSNTCADLPSSSETGE